MSDSDDSDDSKQLENNSELILKCLEKVDGEDAYLSGDEDKPPRKKTTKKVSIECTPETNVEEDEEEEPVPEENRTLVKDVSEYPFRAICYMTMTFKIKKLKDYFGTGFICLVAQKRYLLTAAHNIVKLVDGEQVKARATKLVFGLNGIKRKKDDAKLDEIIVTGDDFVIDQDFEENMGENDFAILDLEPYVDSLPEQAFYIDFGMPPRLEDLDVAGYPGYRTEAGPGPGKPLYTLWKGWCGFRSKASHTHLMYRNTESIGASGAPVFYYGNRERCYVSGIHVGYSTKNTANVAIIANRCFPDVTDNKEGEVEDGVILDGFTAAANDPYVNTSLPHIKQASLLWTVPCKNINCVGFLPRNNIAVGVFKKQVLVLSDRGETVKTMAIKTRNLITNKNGDIILIDDLENTVKHISSSTWQVQREWGNRDFEHALGLAHSRAGHYVISDSIRRRISVWTDKGERITSFGSGKEFSFPAYLLWDDERGRILVSDWENNLEIGRAHV